MKHDKILQLENTVLVVIDIQEAFRNVVQDFEKIAQRTALAIEGFQLLNVPILITEQYPKGLGHTAKEILEKLPNDFQVIEKSTFSSFDEPNFVKELEKTKAKQVVVCGLETHVCVNQTVHDLLANGFQVQLLTDCISSRFSQDRKIGLKKMTENGAIQSCLEMALFELLVDSKHPKFKEIQNLIK
jgi:nicotinamidase-related amidase